MADLNLTGFLPGTIAVRLEFPGQPRSPGTDAQRIYLIFTAELIDFDLCVKRKRRPVRLRQIPGTPAYVAPEVLMRQRADEQADIFSFGVVAYELVTRHKPFERDTLEMERAAQIDPQVSPTPLERFAPDLPRGLRDLILKSLAKDTTKRYPAMSSVLKALESLR